MKSVPKLRFKEFKGEWTIELLNDLLEFKNGVNANKEQYGRGIKFINVLDILNNDYLTYDLIVGSVDIDEGTFKKYLVSFGDILFQRSSETREEVGTACVYLDDRPATFGGFVIRGKKVGNYDPVFFNKLLKTDLARNAITSKSGGSTRYNVGQETLSSVRLPFPSLPEQQKIASFLTAVDEKIQQLTRKKELLEQYKKGVMQRLFSGKLRFKDPNGKPYPKWEEKKLEDICDYKNGGSFENLVSDDGIYNLITLNSININGNLKAEHKKVSENDNSLSKGDLVIVLSDVAHGYFLGLSDVIPGDNYVLNQRMGALKPKVDVSRYFLKSIINFNQKYFKLMGQGSSQKNLSKGDVLSFKMHLPILEEQQKIASFLTALDTKIESVTTQITQTQTFKKGLLQQMFV